MITPPLNFLFWGGKIQNRTNQASRIGYVADCVPQLRRVAIFISVSSHYNGFLDDFFTMGFIILTNLHNTNLRTSFLFSSKPLVLRVYRSLSSNSTTPLQTFCKADSLLKFIRSRNPDHNSQKSWLITKLLSLAVTSNENTSNDAMWLITITNSVTFFQPFSHFAKQNMIWILVKQNWLQFLETAPVKQVYKQRPVIG